MILSKPIAAYSALAFWVLACGCLVPSFRKLFISKILLDVSPTSGYLNGFDALRGLAAGYVFIAHSWHWSFPIFKDAQLSIPQIAYGTKAVAMFTMLSGYLIFRSLYHVDITTHELRKYILRRFFRIYPLYLFSIILFCIFSTTYFDNNYSVSSFSFIMSDVFMLPAFFSPHFGNPVTWSLYVEVLFYLILPFLVWGIPKKYQLSFSIITFFIFAIIDVDFGRFVCLWKYFFLGIIAYKFPLKYPILKNNLISSFLVALGMICLFFDLSDPKYDIFTTIGFIQQVPGNYCTIGLGLSFGLLIMSLPFSSRLSSLLNFMPFRALGLISYSIFLLHPVYLALNFPELKAMHLAGSFYETFKQQNMLPNWFFFGIFIPGFLFWALVSYRLIERPFINLGKKISLYGRL